MKVKDIKTEEITMRLLTYWKKIGIIGWTRWMEWKLQKDKLYIK
jgi:hypothetical protein